MNEKVTEFKGIYTNKSEVVLPMTYSKTITGRITKSYLESKRYQSKNFLEFTENVLYAQEVMLDDDKFAVEYIDGDYKQTYSYDPQYYLLIIYKYVIYANSAPVIENPNREIIVLPIEDNVTLTDTNLKNTQYLNIIDDAIDKGSNIGPYDTDQSKATYIVMELRQYDDEGNFTIVKRSFLKSLFIKAINEKGIVYIITENETYQLQRIRRTTNRISDEKRYTEEGIYLTLMVNDNRSFSIVLETATNTETSVTRKSDLSIHAVFETATTDPDNIEWEYWLYLRDTVTNQVVQTIKYYKYYEGTEAEGDMTNSVLNERGYYPILKDSMTYDELSALEGKTIEANYTDSVTTDNGFPTSIFKIWTMTTYLLDNGSEIIIDSQKIDEISMTSPFTLILTYEIPYNLTTRIISMRHYIKTREYDNYEIIFEKSFFDNTTYDTRYLTRLELSGIYSSQTMGLIDPLKKDYITKFEDFIFINGIMIVIGEGSILYPVVGNGQFTKTFYDTNYIPDVDGDIIFNVNNNLGVRSYEGIKIINIESRDGVLLFSLKDEIGIIVNDKEDIVETPDGIILHTNQGIYALNGQSIELLSEAINDIIEEDFEESNIFFDITEQELWYCNNKNKKIYVYDLYTKTWTTPINYIYSLNIVRMRNKDRLLISNNSIKKIEKIDSDIVLESNLINLNEMNYLNKIIYILFDFEGEIEYNNVTIKSDTRTTKVIYVPLNKRIPKKYSEYIFNIKANTKLYGYEVFYEIENRIGLKAI